jgi:GNAT superfamily N-acetyltransferase
MMAAKPETRKEPSVIRFRQAGAEDVPELVAMLRQFVTSTRYRKYVGENPEALRGFLLGIIEHPTAAIFVSERAHRVTGMIGVLGCVHPMSGEKCVSELFWWLNPAERGAGAWLLRRAEKWALHYGATSIQMAAPVDKPRVAETYAALGYEPMETSFHKRLP